MERLRCPTIFTQVFTIMGKIERPGKDDTDKEVIAVPLVYALLSSMVQVQ